MIQRIDLFLLGETQYNVLDHFTIKLKEALDRFNVPTRLVPVASDGTVELDWRDLPTLTLCFNGIPESGDATLQLCDQIGVPHVSLLVDPPTRYTRLVESPFMIIGCDDKSGPRILKEMNFTHAFFLPHAVEKDVSFDPDTDRPYDVTLLATYIDHEAVRDQWRSIFPEPIAKAMDDAIDVAFSDDATSFIEAFIQSVINHVPESRNQNVFLNPYIMELCWRLEFYIKGRERTHLIQSITGPKVHVFGTTASKRGWQEAVGDQENVVVHPSVSFDEAMEIMKKSRIVLNSSLKNKEGAHERIFSGLACGALVATTDNPYMRDQFSNDKNIVLYSHSKIDTLNDRLEHYLSDERKRKAVVETGRQNVADNHTWDNRANVLMEVLPRFLQNLPISK